MKKQGVGYKFRITSLINRYFYNFIRYSSILLIFLRKFYICYNFILIMIKIKKEALLIKPEDIKSSSKDLEVVGVINPAAIRRKDGKIILFVRVVERLKILEDENYCYSPRMVGKDEYELRIDRFNKKNIASNSNFDIIFKDRTKRLTFVSHLRMVVLDEGGFKVLSIDNKPSFHGLHRDSELGIEDPRITFVNNKYAMTYVSLSRKENISTSLALSKDLVSWKRKGIIFGEQDKDVVIFPEKINGKYVALDRPEGNFQFSPPHIWIAYSDNLSDWGNLKSLNISKKTNKDYGRIGAGCPPIKTEKGWLLIYHTVREDKKISIYSGAAALLDLDNPKKVISKTPPLIVPTQDYETELFENKKIVFPTGIVFDKNNKDLLIYSGGGDRVTSVKKIALDEILRNLKKIKK